MSVAGFLWFNVGVNPWLALVGYKTIVEDANWHRPQVLLVELCLELRLLAGLALLFGVLNSERSDSLLVTARELYIILSENLVDVLLKLRIDVHRSEVFQLVLKWAHHWRIDRTCLNR